MSRQKEMPRWASVLFLMIGAYIVAISLGVLPEGTPLRNARRAIFDNAQHWQVTSLGFAFFSGGIVVAFSKSKHWLLAMVRVATAVSFLTPMYWIVFASGVMSTPFKIIWAIPLVLGTAGAVLGMLQEAGLINITSQAGKLPSGGADPIREAETYLAYGRTAQAVDVLNAAMRHSPSRAAEFQRKIDEIRQK